MITGLGFGLEDTGLGLGIEHAVLEPIPATKRCGLLNCAFADARPPLTKATLKATHVTETLLINLVEYSNGTK